MRSLIVASLAYCIAVVQAQIEIPRSGPAGQIVSHVGYTLSYNEEHEQANWVAYELTAQEVQGIVSRSDDFRADPEIEVILDESLGWMSLVPSFGIIWDL